MSQASNSQNTSGYVISIGASAGGLEAIEELLTELPEDLNAPIVIAMHSEPTSRLTEVLKYKSSLPIKVAEIDEDLSPGVIYVVPGAKHAFFTNGRLRLSEVVNNSGFRPSIDALFMTMAAEYGAKSIAVVLSGTLKDGMRGAQIVYDMGGRTIVQDPEDAKHAGMPNSVIYGDHPEAIRTASELGKWIAREVGVEG